MERITGNEVQSMMEAYASIYNNQEQEVISEETQELEEQQGGAMRGIRGPLHYLDTLLQGRKKADEIARNRGVLPKNGGGSGGSGGGSGGNTGSGMTPAQVKAAQDAANKARQQGKMSDLRGGGGNTGKSPISNLSNALDKPSVVSPTTGETTKFERRLPTRAELEAAKLARDKAKADGATDREAGYQAAKAGVGVSKGTVADPKIAADAKRKAELERIRSRASSQTQAGVRPTVASTADPKTPPAVPAAKPATGGSGGYQVSAAATPKTRPANPAAAVAVAKAAEVKKRVPRPGARNRGVYGEGVDIFDTIKEHLISEHELSEDVAIQVMTLLDEETRGEIMEYNAQMRADAAPKGTVKMTADGKEPPGERLLKGIGKKIGGFLNRLNPNALQSTTVEPRKPLVSTQKNSYELEGELVDEGSCGSKPKKKTSSKKKGGY